MKFLIAFFFVNLSIIFCFGQSKQLDSLRNELKENKTASLKIALLLDLAFEFRFTNPDSMRYYANSARLLGVEVDNIYGQLQGLRNIALAYLNEGDFDTSKYLLKKVILEAKEKNEDKILLDAYNSLGRIYYSKSDYDSAIIVFQFTYELSEQLNGAIDKAGALLNIGGSLEEKGNAVQAASYFNSALLIFDSLNHPYGIATASYNLANIFQDQGDYDKALSYYTKVAEIDSTTGNKRDFASTLASIAEIMLHKNDTFSALTNYKRSIALYDATSANCLKVVSINNLGDLFLDLKQLDSAKKYIDQALEIATECEMPKQIAAIRFDLGKYYSVVSNVTLAKDNFTIAYNIAIEYSLKQMQANAALKLYGIYKEESNLQESLLYLEIARSIEKELFNQENTRKIAQLEAEYEMEKERQKFQFQQEKSEIAYQESISGERSIKYQILLGFIILSVLLVIILSLYFQKNKLNYKLEKTLADTKEQNLQIKEQNEEISQQAELIESRSQELEQQKSELEITNNKLTELNEEKNTIIGIVAHDLKSPLNQVKGFISLLKLEHNNKENFSQYLKMIEDAANRSIQMIIRILDINALDNSAIVIKEEKVNLKSLLQQVQSDYLLQASNKEIDLQLYSENEIVIQSDSDVLQQVLDNLLSNAIKFSPSKSIVKISSEERERYYSISIQDNGPGITNEDKFKIFRKYEQGSASPTANEKSTGLGLAIVKRFLDALKYEIECMSDGKNGTTFIIKIPK
jgi:signal transduction histidine kinase